MRLNGKEQLLYAATAKVILPKEDFPKLVMSLHNKGEDSTGKHRSFMKTLQLVCILNPDLRGCHTVTICQVDPLTTQNIS